MVLRQRLDTALIYLNDNPNSMAVVTGGLGNQASVTEAYAMGDYLINHGINPERIIYEEWSTSTQENLFFAKQLLDGHFYGQDYTVVIVTNDFHLPPSNLWHLILWPQTSSTVQMDEGVFELTDNIETTKSMPYVYTTAKRLNDDMPEFIFAVTSHQNPNDPDHFYRHTIEIYQHSYIP